MGKAIGTKMAPPYAVLFLRKLEEGFLEAQSLKPKVWWRYIDDIFICCGNAVKKTLKYFLKLLITATQLLNLQLIG